MISSEMSELIGMSDRIMVMCDGRVTGFRVLSHSETPGLGAKMGEWFSAEGTSHDVTGHTQPFTLKNHGGDIDAITGATITSQAFMEALNRAAEACANKNSEP